MKNCFPVLGSYRPDAYDAMRQSFEAVQTMEPTRSKSLLIEVAGARITADDYRLFKECDFVSFDCMRVLSCCLLNSCDQQLVTALQVIRVDGWNSESGEVKIGQVFDAKQVVEANASPKKKTIRVRQNFLLLCFRSNWYLIVNNSDSQASLYFGGDCFEDPSKFEEFCGDILDHLQHASTLCQSVSYLEYCANNGLIVFARVAVMLGIKAEWQSTPLKFKKLALWAVHSVFLLTRFDQIKANVDEAHSSSTHSVSTGRRLPSRGVAVLNASKPVSVGADDDSKIEKDKALEGLDKSHLKSQKKIDKSRLGKSRISKATKLPTIIRKNDPRLTEKHPNNASVIVGGGGSGGNGGKPFYGFGRDFSSSDSSHQSMNVKQQLHLGSPGNPLVMGNPNHYNNHLVGTSPFMYMGQPPLGGQHLLQPQRAPAAADQLPPIHASNKRIGKVPSYHSSFYSQSTTEKKKKSTSSSSSSSTHSKHKSKKKPIKKEKAVVPDPNPELEDELTELEQKYVLAKPTTQGGAGNADKNAVNYKIKNYLDDLNKNYNIVKMEFTKLDEGKGHPKGLGQLKHKHHELSSESHFEPSNSHRFVPVPVFREDKKRESDDERHDEYQQQKLEYEKQREIVIRKNKLIKEQNLKKKLEAKHKMTDKLENINSLMVVDPQ